MSAFIVSDNQIAVVVAAYNAALYQPLPQEQLQAMANELKRENIRSVNWRYNERSRLPKYGVRFNESLDGNFTTAMVINMANCIEYQSCERPDYEKSKAFALLNQIRLELYRHQFGETVERQASGVWSI